VLPAWTRWSTTPWVRRALTGVNAAVVGVLAWTLDPIGVQALRSPVVAVLAAVLVVAHGPLKAPAWAVVVAGALGGWALGLIPQ
jgi:chromate transporter